MPPRRTRGWVSHCCAHPTGCDFSGNDVPIGTKLTIHKNNRVSLVGKDYAEYANTITPDFVDGFPFAGVDYIITSTDHKAKKWLLSEITQAEVGTAPVTGLSREEKLALGWLAIHECGHTNILGKRFTIDRYQDVSGDSGGCYIRPGNNGVPLGHFNIYNKYNQSHYQLFVTGATYEVMEIGDRMST